MSRTARTKKPAPAAYAPPATGRTARSRQQPRRNGVGRPKGGSSAVDTRELITTAALRLFSDAGFVSVSVKDIANAAGVNAALIYYYFDSKDELFRRAVTLAAHQAFARFRTLATHDPEPTAAVGKWIDCHERTFVHVARLVKLSLTSQSPNGPMADARAQFLAFQRETRAMLRAALARGGKARALSDVEIDQTADLMATFVDGVYVRSLLLAKFDAKAELATLRAFATDRLKGVR